MQKYLIHHCWGATLFYISFLRLFFVLPCDFAYISIFSKFQIAGNGNTFRIEFRVSNSNSTVFVKKKTYKNNTVIVEDTSFVINKSIDFLLIHLCKLMLFYGQCDNSCNWQKWFCLELNDLFSPMHLYVCVCM